MPEKISRRGFLAESGTAAIAAATVTAGETRTAGDDHSPSRFQKAVKFQMIQVDRPVADKFKMLVDLGFDGVEIATNEPTDRREFRAASEATGLPIHGVLHSTRPDLRGAIDLAKYYGGTSVLVVAGRVNEKMPYDRNYQESQATIRAAIEHAERQQVDLLVENVWNNFLLSPLEMARYIDEFDSPHVGVYFDVGNVVRIGWPDQWIRILGSRIRKLDIKEYSRQKQLEEGLRKGFQVEIGEGDCDWPNVRKALAAINYRGWATAEVPGGNRQRLQAIAERMDRVLQG